MKICRLCKTEKPLTDYHSSGKGKHRGTCKLCLNASRRKEIKKKNCAICGGLFSPMMSTQKYCCWGCKKEADLKARSNKPETKDCKFCGGAFKPYTSLDKFCSANCRVENMKSKRSKRWNEQSTLNRMGENNPSYKHGERMRGVKKDNSGQRLFNKNKKEYRQEMIDRVGYLYCENCHEFATRFEMHHIIYRSEKPRHPNLHDKINMINLCVPCHNKFHSKKSIREDLVESRGLVEVFGMDILNKKI